MTKFKHGDKVICVLPDTFGFLQRGKIYTVQDISLDYETVSFDDSGYWDVDRFELFSIPTTAQQKLDQLKKYFESSNDVPVQQATIKAKDFWAIYNS